jgi:hypothetical protein
MSILWKQRVGFVGLLGVYYVFTLHANLMGPQPLAAPLFAPLDTLSSAELLARPASPESATTALVSPLAPNHLAPAQFSPRVAAPPRAAAVVAHRARAPAAYNATRPAVGAGGAVTAGGAWSGTYKCYDYGETFAAAFLCHVDAFKGTR